MPKSNIEGTEVKTEGFRSQESEIRLFLAAAESHKPVPFFILARRCKFMLEKASNEMGILNAYSVEVLLSQQPPMHSR